MVQAEDGRPGDLMRGADGRAQAFVRPYSAATRPAISRFFISL